MTPNKSKHMGRCGEFTITERLTGTRSAYYVAHNGSRLITSTDFATLVFKLRGKCAGVK
jgi:hypothetical protein